MVVVCYSITITFTFRKKKKLSQIKKKSSNDFKHAHHYRYPINSTASVQYQALIDRRKAKTVTLFLEQMVHGTRIDKANTRKIGVTKHHKIRGKKSNLSNCEIWENVVVEKGDAGRN